MLHLDIDHHSVHSVETALAHHLASLTLTDYKPEGSAHAAHATKHMYLNELPSVLVLHLKRFQYSGNSTVKNHKHVVFEPLLRLRKPMLDERFSSGTAEYRLVSTISHHGRHAAGGHYTADVLQPEGRWLRFNDALVDAVGHETVLAEKPYILLYAASQLPPR